MLLSFPLATFAEIDDFEVVRFYQQDVTGEGPLPYNYRIIDLRIHAGGHPLNPQTRNGKEDFSNTDEQVMKIFKLLKANGVKVVVDLENTARIQARYQKLLDRAGMKRIHVPLHSGKVPNQDEWKIIKAAMENPVYIHCKWGADRTGAVVGRYLVEEKGYAPEIAYAAVLSGGTHTGVLGGLKEGQSYEKLKAFIWNGATQVSASQ